MKEVLIIGAGQLGERSIQSLRHKNSKYKISFYEKNIERSDFIKNTYNVNQINSIDNLVRYDVIHVATTSKGRHEILKIIQLKKIVWFLLRNLPRVILMSLKIKHPGQINKIIWLI